MRSRCAKASASSSSLPHSRRVCTRSRTSRAIACASSGSFVKRDLDRAGERAIEDKGVLEGGAETRSSWSACMARFAYHMWTMRHGGRASRPCCHLITLGRDSGVIYLRVGNGRTRVSPLVSCPISVVPIRLPNRLPHFISFIYYPMSYCPCAVRTVSQFELGLRESFDCTVAQIERLQCHNAMS